MKTSDIIIGTYPGGAKSGKALAIFASEEEAQDAKLNLDKEYIGSRYIDLFDCSHRLMQKECGLEQTFSNRYDN